MRSCGSGEGTNQAPVRFFVSFGEGRANARFLGVCPPCTRAGRHTTRHAHPAPAQPTKGGGRPGRRRQPEAATARGGPHPSFCFSARALIQPPPHLVPGVQHGVARRLVELGLARHFWGGWSGGVRGGERTTNKKNEECCDPHSLPSNLRVLGGHARARPSLVPHQRTHTRSHTMAEHLASLFGTEKDRVNVSKGRGERGARSAGILAVARRPPPALRACEITTQTRQHQNSHSNPHLFFPQCPFYFKIGACRHGDRCSRAHNKPSVSPTLLLRNLYENRAAGSAAAVTARDARGLPASAAASSSSASQADFEAFYEDVFEELARYGRLDALNVCDNVADHLVGAVYAQWADEASAAAAHADLNGRFYEGRPIVAEFSPVTDFREVRIEKEERREER